MKILHVITTLYTGGAERLMVDLLPRFKEAGHDVELLVFNPVETPFTEKLIAAGIKLHYLNCKNVYSPRNLFRLRPYLDKYDIIHTHNTACQYYVAMAARIFGSRSRLITTEHNTTNRRRNIPFFSLVDRYMYRRYSHIISVSEATTENLRCHIGDRVPITTIHNGVNLKRFIHKPNVDPDVFKIIMVAAFRPQKDQDTIVRALPLLPQNVKLVLVGEGNRRKIVTKLAEDLGVADRVTFTGVLTNISEMLMSCSAVVLSSHWEGFGLAAVEGLATGRPVVASNVEGLRNTIGDAGLFFEAGNERELAQCITRLMSDRELYDRLSVEALVQAKKYDIDETTRKYLELYES